MTALDTLQRNRAMANGTLDGSSWAVTNVTSPQRLPDPPYVHLVGQHVRVEKGPYIFDGILLASTSDSVTVRLDEPGMEAAIVDILHATSVVTL